MPDYVVFETTYPINRHDWWLEFWQRESDLSFDTHQARLAVLATAYTIMDEAYEMSTEHIQRQIEEIPSLREAMRDTIIEMSNASGLPPEQIERLLADEAHSTGQGSTTEEATDEDERG